MVALPHCVINRRARLTNVVLDRGVEIPADMVIGEDAATDASRFRRTEGGVVLVTQQMLDALAG